MTTLRNVNGPTATTSGTERLSADRRRRFRRQALAWGASHRRAFPWRATRDPWAILVSEVMLQQTQAERVVVPYSRFLAAFPNPATCARAGAAEVVRVWAGLGFNRRALHLHAAATSVTSRHAGAVPRDLRALMALPGVGSYTARAVLSFGHGIDAAVVDTNVLRVLSRCVHGTGLTTAEAQRTADELLPPAASWEFNQSMFDLGATVCTAQAPRCSVCPLSRQCRWRAGGGPEAGADPWRACGSVRAQPPFAGSDRQGRGRLLAQLRERAVRHDEIATACGWPRDAVRAERIARALVDEGFAEWLPGPGPLLRLR